VNTTTNRNCTGKAPKHDHAQTHLKDDRPQTKFIKKMQGQRDGLANMRITNKPTSRICSKSTISNIHAFTYQLDVFHFWTKIITKGKNVKLWNDPRKE